MYFKKQANSQAVVEGEKLIVQCKVYGTDPKISWKVGECQINWFDLYVIVSNNVFFSSLVGNRTYDKSEDRVVLSADDRGIENSILTIESATLDDREFYNCTAVNDANLYGNFGYDIPVESIYVRVKGSLDQSRLRDLIANCC